MTQHVPHHEARPAEFRSVADDAHLRRLLLSSSAVRGWYQVVDDLDLPGGGKVDVAVVSEELDVFLIKAEQDGLNALPREAAEFDSHFRRSSIVTVPAHLPQVEKLVPAHWGIWVSSGAGRGRTLRCVRKAAPHWRRETTKVAKLLRHDERIALVERWDPVGDVSKLEIQVTRPSFGLGFTLQQLDAHVMTCIKLRDLAAQNVGTPKQISALPRRSATLSLGNIVQASLQSVSAAPLDR